jgi:2-polyprenyl-3-methyl-5-hydroxy-6-metoxy-1,4-benzoquinol methylase
VGFKENATMNERAGYDAPDERAENLTHNDLGIGRLRCVREVPRKGAFEFFNRLNILSGTRLLDVACGAGQLTLPAARTGIQVTDIDLAANLVQQARATAAAGGLAIHVDEGDAENLPYPARRSMS